METYKDLGSKYLKQNRRRSFITVLGCFIVSTILFMLLNSLVCWVENCREEAREEDDFEILVLTDDRILFLRHILERHIPTRMRKRHREYMQMHSI